MKCEKCGNILSEEDSVIKVKEKNIEGVSIRESSICLECRNKESLTQKLSLYESNKIIFNFILYIGIIIFAYYFFSILQNEPVNRVDVNTILDRQIYEQQEQQTLEEKAYWTQIGR